MKTFILFLLIMTILAFSVHAECCYLKSVEDNDGKINNLYLKLDGNVRPNDLCRNLAGILDVEYDYYTESCSVPLGNHSIADGSILVTPEQIIQIASTSRGGSHSGGYTLSSTCSDVSYTCGSWSTCADSSQTRTCAKVTKCGVTTKTSDVTETQSCETPRRSSSSSTETEDEDSEDTEETGSETTNQASTRQNPESGEEAGLSDVTGRAVATPRSNTNIWIASGVVALVAVLGVGSYFMFFRGKGKK